ncbi:MAG: hypothetical protein LCH54_15535 [Bacteroidetes bacterium]|nr:hypothetical protein [Bacteroidota bacterium]
MVTQSKYDLVCVVAESDQYCATPIWIDLVLKDSKGYTKSNPSKDLLNGEKAIVSTMHELELKFMDASGMAQLRTWYEAGTKVKVFCFGYNGSLIWNVGSTFIMSSEPDSGDGSPLVYSLKMSEAGIRDIRNGINLLSPSLSRGTSTSWFGTPTNGTFSSTSKNVGFSLGNEPIFKLTQATPALAAVFTRSSSGGFKIPVKTGMKFSVLGNTYLYNQASSFNRKIGLKVFDSVPTQTELLVISDSNAGERTLSGTITISNDLSRHAALHLEVNNTGGTATGEFDDLMLVYGEIVPTSFNEG